ncbi:MAG: phenylalanine--tRNA ligase subunit alpha [Erysipelotrichales bacterium]|nr:phenylalanine--tRNA ligase subunit alpha [Erysipelotrichales bacterium]
MEDLELNELYEEALKAIDEVDSIEKVNEVRNDYLSKKSKFMGLMSKMKELSIEGKKVFGEAINKAKDEITRKLEEKRAMLEKRMLDEKLKREEIDVTLPGINYDAGGKNPFYIIQDEMIDIFLGMGYEIAEGPEVELDHFNFELLNIPKDHPARDMQDTFYIDDNTLMRTHTSPVQARVMQEKQGKPIKIICPGKVYRRDDDDATHSHQFGQIEGLVVDKNITLSNLKATLELFIKKMYGEKREIRLRSSYFPFTEPSVEVDVSCDCGGKGTCSKCKGTGWIEILGGGMVHPNVLSMSGYDPKEYQGFAFGVGIERVAMLRYGVDDIRRFYQNDVRFLNQFKRK